jgi:dihydrofolate reductase
MIQGQTALAGPAGGRPLRYREVIMFVNSSVDGFMGSPSGDLGWLVHDDEMDHDFTSDLRRTADTILSGRVVFESFAVAWPARAADRRRGRAPA